MAIANKQEKFSAFCKRIASSEKLPAFIFFISENASELEALLKVLREKLQRQFGACDEAHISGLDNDVASWHGEMMTMPMFPSGRLILVRHSEHLLKRIENQPKVLTNYLRDFERIPEFTVSVLQFDEKKIGKKLQILEDLAVAFEESIATPHEIYEDLSERAQALGYNVEREIIELIVDRSAGQLKIALANFDRLLTYRMAEKSIRLEDVEEIVSQSDSNLHFRLIDETARRNIGECLRILELHALDEAEQLIAALVRLFSEALRYHYYRENGVALDTIGKTMNARPLTGYPLKKSAERWATLLQKYSPAGVRFVMDALVRADQACKESRDSAGQQVIITSFYLMLARGRQN